MQCYGFSTLHYVSLQETCTTSYALGNKCTKKQLKGNNLKEWQEMLYKISQRGITKKQNKVELHFLCIALPVIARNMHAKFGVI